MATAKYNHRTRQEKTSAALIEPLILTRDDVQSTDVPDAFCRIVVARTFCHWSSVNIIATVQIANPFGTHVHLKRKMLLPGRLHLAGNKSVLTLNVSTIQMGSAKSDSTRDELRKALKDSLKKQHLLGWPMCTTTWSVYEVSIGIFASTTRAINS